MRALALVVALLMTGAASAPAPPWIWGGDAGWRIDGEPRVQTGERSVGDAAIEVDLASVRTGTIASDITLTSDRFGPLLLRAGTPVIAFRRTLIVQGPNEPAHSMPADLEWCTATAERHICVTQPSIVEMLAHRGADRSALPFNYAEYQSGSMRLSRELTERRWSGPEPAIRQEDVAFPDQVHRRITIRSITAVGVTVSNDIAEGSYVAQGASSQTIPFGIKVHGGDEFGGVGITFMPDGTTHVLVTNTPPEPGEIELH